MAVFGAVGLTADSQPSAGILVHRAVGDCLHAYAPTITQSGIQNIPGPQQPPCALPHSSTPPSPKVPIFFLFFFFLMFIHFFERETV